MKKLLTMCTLLFCNTMFAPEYEQERENQVTVCFAYSAIMVGCIMLCHQERQREQRLNFPPTQKTSSPNRKQKMQ